MNFVKSHKQYGVDAKEIPCLTGLGEPTTETDGAVGCLYMDESTGDLYKCTAAIDGVYTWVALEVGTSGGNTDGGNGTNIVTFDLVALGLPNMNADTGEIVTLETDTAVEIAAAMESKFVQFVFNFDYRGLAFSNVIVTVPPNCGYGVTGFGGNTVFFSIAVSDGTITASAKLFSAWHGLPEVTTTDDGKILQVVDGAWVAAEEEPAEDELPTVTAEDNGKFLRVADGVWTAVAVAAAETASF